MGKGGGTSSYYAINGVFHTMQLWFRHLCHWERLILINRKTNCFILFSRLFLSTMDALQDVPKKVAEIQCLYLSQNFEP